MTRASNVFAVFRTLTKKSKANLLRYWSGRLATSCRTQIVLSMINFGLNEESIAIMRKYWESVAGIDEGRIKSFTTWDGNAEAVNCGKSAGWNHSRDFDCCA